MILCLGTWWPTQALPTELWFNNPCIYDLLEQLVELGEEVRRHISGVNVPVPQLKWFMQHLVTMMSVITWLTSLNQSQKYYTGFVNHSKQQNIPGSHISFQICRLYISMLTPEKLYVTSVLVERSWEKKRYSLVWLAETFLLCRWFQITVRC